MPSVTVILSIFPKEEWAVLMRHALDNYEYFLALEKERRIEQRKDGRIMRILDSLTMPALFDDPESLMQQIEEHVGDKMLERRIFGSLEREFPEIEDILEVRTRKTSIHTHSDPPAREGERRVEARLPAPRGGRAADRARLHSRLPSPREAPR